MSFALTPHEKIRKRLETHLHDLSIPHGAFTPEEKKVQITLFKKLKKLGIQPQIEDFSIPFHPYRRRRWFLANNAVLWGIFMLIFFLFQRSPLLLLGSIGGLGFTLLLNFVILSAGPLSHSLRKKVSKTISTDSNPITFSSKNIIFNLKSRKHSEFGLPLGVLVIFAPYGSIQTLWKPKWFYMFTKNKYIVGGGLLVSNFLYSLTISYSSFTSVFISLWNIFNIVLLSIFLFFLLLNFWIPLAPSKLSSQDSETGAAPSSLLLELIHQLLETEFIPDWVDLRIVFTGADILYNQGSLHFLSTHISDLQRSKDIYLLKINEINTPIRLRMPINFPMSTESSQTSYIFRKLFQHIAVLLKIKTMVVQKWPSLSAVRYSQKIRHYFHKILNIGRTPTLGAGLPTHKASEGDLDAIQSCLNLLYNILMSIDKRIADKIGSGE